MKLTCLYCGRAYFPYVQAFDPHGAFCSFGCHLHYARGDTPESLNIGTSESKPELFPVHPSDRNIPTVGFLNIPEGWQDANGFHYGKQPKPESR